MENWCRSKKPLRINVKSSALNFKWKVNSNLKNTTKNRHLLCWILLYCSWRISEITSAVPCKAVMRNSLTYTRSAWRTPCTKAALVLAHDVKGMLHWSQLCQGQEHTTEFFRHPMLKSHQYGMDCMGLAPPHTSCANLQQRFPGYPHPAVLPQLPAHQELHSARCVPACVPCSPSAPSHTVLVCTFSGTKWPPCPSPLAMLCFQMFPDLYNWARHLHNADWHRHRAQILCL